MQLLKDISTSLLEVLHQLPDNYYTQPILILEQHTIGQQVRHLAEHWQILSDNYEHGFVDYGNRKRKKEIEQHKTTAILLLSECLQLTERKDIELSVSSLDGETVFSSTYFRELDNVAEHIIHHNAIIKMAILSLDADYIFPANFGYAPSTVSFNKQVCVQ